ncbi:hypothetical protein CYMTET_10639 [Cymbomonas tetramitiformis]|uniref:Uncharacterized protein n=1 Tax=Cymbomonas tetramitiformis TaxID=36881 RepID=A0AAE0GQA7_9CHLO|nr:hypothetical protein CYMTET_10639 [Cymbomonas tetramitiformis]
MMQQMKDLNTRVEAAEEVAATAAAQSGGSALSEWGRRTGGTATVTVRAPRLGEFFSSDEVLIKLIAKIDRIENFIETHRTGGLLPCRKGLTGFRAGSHPDPHVGFDGKQRKAVPKCPRCPTAGDGHKYPSWFDCPLDGKREEAGSTVAYCQPVDDCTPEVLHTLAIAPTVVDAGAASGGVDVTAYGFAVSDSEDSDGEDMDMDAELQQLRREVSEATRGVRFNQATFILQVSMGSAAIDGDDAQSALFTQPSEGFSATVGFSVPPWGLGPHMPVVLLACIILCFGVAGVAAAVHGVTGKDDTGDIGTPVVCYGHACIYRGIDALSPVVRDQVLAAFRAAAQSGGANVSAGGAPGGAGGDPTGAAGYAPFGM